MKEFSQLTQEGQARRLRRLALAALQDYDLDLRRMSLLSNSFNAIYRIDTTGGEKYVLRVSLPGMRSLEEVRSEMTWLAALRRDTDLHVPLPFPTRKGDLVTTAEGEDVPAARHCTVFSWVPGKDLAQQISPVYYERLGVLAARLHNHAESYTPPEGFWLKTMDKVIPAGTPDFFGEEYEHLFPPERRKVFERAFERVEEALGKLYARPANPHVLHADLHQGNVKVYRGKLYALDFDDTMIGYPVQDAAISFYYILHHPEYGDLREAYQRGYASERPWPEAYPGQIDAFVAGRAFLLVNFLVQDPRYQQMAPGFIERTEKDLRAYLDKSIP